MIFLSFKNSKAGWMWRIMSEVGQKGREKMISNWRSTFQALEALSHRILTHHPYPWMTEWQGGDRISEVPASKHQFFPFLPFKRLLKWISGTSLWFSISISSVFNCSNHTACEFLCKAFAYLSFRPSTDAVRWVRQGPPSFYRWWKGF